MNDGRLLTEPAFDVSQNGDHKAAHTPSEGKLALRTPARLGHVGRCRSMGRWLRSKNASAPKQTFRTTPPVPTSPAVIF